MKKITGLVLLAIVISTSSFATHIHDNVDKQVSNAFGRKFADAKEVSWSKTEQYAKASFTQHGQVFFAYFTPTGELMAVSRNILSSTLPIKLLTGLKKDYSNEWITDLFEFATEQETVYYATLENADEKILLKSVSLNTWSVYQTIKKI